MNRLITNFISDNQEKWVQEDKKKEKAAKEEIKNWDRIRRFEKIEKLKKRVT